MEGRYGRDYFSISFQTFSLLPNLELFVRKLKTQGSYWLQLPLCLPPGRYAFSDLPGMVLASLLRKMRVFFEKREAVGFFSLLDASLGPHCLQWVLRGSFVFLIYHIFVMKSFAGCSWAFSFHWPVSRRWRDFFSMSKPFSIWPADPWPRSLVLNPGWILFTSLLQKVSVFLFWQRFPLVMSFRLRSSDQLNLSA